MMYAKQGNFHIARVQRQKARVKPIHAKEPKETLTQIYNRLEEKPAILINGGLFNMSDGKGISGLMIDGKVIKEREYGGCVMWQRSHDGQIDMNVFKDGIEVKDFIGWTDWVFESGPVLTPYIQGNILKNLSHSKHPRTAIGFNDHEIIALVTEPRPYGITCPELGEEMKKLGCTKAINLDGGGSSEMLVNGKKVVGGNRPVDNAIAIYLDEVPDTKPPTDSKQAPILIIDPGHGGKDPGGGTCDRWKEKDMVLQISLYQQKRFLELGIPVTLTRTSDQYLDSAARTKLVRDSGAQYCISNHINAGGGQGAEVIHSIFDSGKLANKIMTELVYVGARKRRVFTRTYPNNPNQDYYFMHRETGRVSTQIVEYGFADNREDADFITEHWRDLAEAVVKAFCEHIGSKYKSPAPASEDKLYRVQVGAFKSADNAKLLVEELKKKGYPATVV